jgi:hypothetical protein
MQAAEEEEELLLAVLAHSEALTVVEVLEQDLLHQQTAEVAVELLVQIAQATLITLAVRVAREL